MTERQTIFAREYVACGNAAEAYRRAYPKSAGWRNGLARKRASELLRRGDIQVTVAELRAQAAMAKVTSYERACEKASALIEDPEADPRVVLAAIECLAKLRGWFRPAQVQVETTDGNRLAAIKEMARQMTPEERAAWLRQNMPQ